MNDTMNQYPITKTLLIAGKKVTITKLDNDNPAEVIIEGGINVGILNYVLSEDLCNENFLRN